MSGKECELRASCVCAHDFLSLMSGKERELRASCVCGQILKLYAWEPSFFRQISEVRNEELNILWRYSLWGAGMTFSWTVAPYAVSPGKHDLLQLKTEHYIVC